MSSVLLAASGTSSPVATVGNVKKTTKVVSVSDLQVTATTESGTIQQSEKSPLLKLQLTNLNPAVGSWFILNVEYGKLKTSLHLELQFPETDKLSLATTGLQITRQIQGGMTVEKCDPINDAFFSMINADQKENRSYSEFCADRIVVRHQINGRQTAKEFVTGFLRDKVWGGEKITSIVKEAFFQDKYAISSKPEASVSATTPPPTQLEKLMSQDQPLPAMIGEKYQGQTLTVKDLGISIEDSPDKLIAGRWYAVDGQPNMYLSVVEPGMVDKTILNSHKKIVGNLDKVESNAISLLFAFRRDKFDTSFMVGTDHPRVDWSERALESSVDKTLAGS